MTARRTRRDGLLAYVGVGSNLGRREAYLASAAARLQARGASVLRVSGVYETRPLGVAGAQPDFLNAVLEVGWRGTPEDLLELLLDVEREHGRRRPASGEGARPGGEPVSGDAGGPAPKGDGGGDPPAARPLDLDLLLALDRDGRPLERAGARLTLPHPRIAERAFVRLPLLELGVRLGDGGRPVAVAPDGCGDTREEAMAAAQGVRRRGAFPVWMPDAYTPATVADGLRLRRLGTAWRFLARTESTNEDARAWSAEGAPHGAVIIADEQSRGRGRLGRGWATPAGAALAMTVILRPSWGPQRLSLLPLAAGLAVARAAKRTACLRAGLKWPNDVLVNGRKLAGVLAEALVAPGPLAVALGVGVNLNWPVALMPPDLAARATSVLHETGGPVSRPAFARALLEELDAACDALDRDPAAVLDEWRRRSLTLGREVVVAHGRDTIRGLAVDVAPDGALIVRDAAGEHALHAGEVTLNPAGAG